MDRLLVAALAAQHLVGAVGDHLVEVHVGLGAGAGLPHHQREMIVELARRHLGRRRGDRLADLLVELAHRHVGFGRRLLQQAEGADQRRRHALAADLEILERPLGLRAPQFVARHLDRAEGIALGARVLSAWPWWVPVGECMARVLAGNRPFLKRRVDPWERKVLGCARVRRGPWTAASPPIAACGTNGRASTRRSELYDMAGFRAGETSLKPIELEEVGDVSGQEPPAPAMPFRPGHTVLGAAGREGDGRGPLARCDRSGAGPGEGARHRCAFYLRRRARPQGAGRRAVRHRVHVLRRLELAARSQAPGRR